MAFGSQTTYKNCIKLQFFFNKPYGITMANKQEEIPMKVILTAKAAEAMKERIRSKSLTDDDVTTLVGLVSLSLWMQKQLSRAKLTITQLRKFFGFKTEKNIPKKKRILMM
jgi:hypothetical protein